MAKKHLIAQAAAIPYRRKAGGALEVLLLRRRDGAKWGIPKGVVDPGNTHEQTVAIEAMEEAGAAGKIEDRPLGLFTYEKFGGECVVKVFAMRVERLEEHWLEEKLRERKWFGVEKAIERIGRKALQPMIRDLAGRMRAKKADADRQT